MKKKLTINNFLFLYVLILPILDILKYIYGNIEFLGISIIEVINLLSCFCMLFYVIYSKYKKNKKMDKKVVLFSAITIIYLIFHSINVTKISDSSSYTINIIKETYYIFRAYILPLILLYVVQNIDVKKEKIYKLLSFLAFFISTVIIFFDVLKIGCITYDSYFENNTKVLGNIFEWKNNITINNYVGYGSKGIFVSGNQISLIMVSLLIISSLYLNMSKKWYLYVSFVFKCISMIIISTKTSNFGVFIVILFTIFMLFFDFILNKDKKKLYNVLYYVIILIFCYLLFMISPLSYNLGINSYDKPRNNKAEVDKGNDKGNINNIENGTKEELESEKRVCGFVKATPEMDFDDKFTSLNMRKYIYNSLIKTHEENNIICDYLEENELYDLLKKESYSNEEKLMLTNIIDSYSSFFGIHPSLIDQMPVSEYFDFWMGILKKDNIKSDFRLIKRLMAKELINNKYSSFMGNMFGITFISDFPSIENDVVSQYTWFGFVGIMLFVLPFYLLFINYLVFFIIKFDKNKIIEELYVLASIFMILSLSILSGHWFGDMFSMSILVLLISVCYILKNSNENIIKSNKKKILFVIWSFTMGGGAEKILANIVNNLDPDKYDISIIEYWHTNVNVEKVNENIKILKPVVDSTRENKLIRKIKELLLKYNSSFLRLFYAPEQYDVEVAFNYMFPTFFVRNNVVSYAWFHGDIYDLKKNKYDRFLQSRSIKKFKNIITISKNTYNSIIDVFPFLKSKIIIINNGLCDKQILELSNESIELKDTNYYLYIGRLDENKNPMFLLEVAEIIKKKKLNYKIEIMGVGVLFDKIKYEINNRKLNSIVNLLGFQRNPYPYIKKSKAILLCSKSEGFPTVLLEGILLEKPFISTLVGGVEELSKDSNCGLIASTPEEFIKSMKIMDDKEEYNKFVSNCKVTRKKYLMANQIKKIEKLLS